MGAKHVSAAIQLIAVLVTSGPDTEGGMYQHSTLAKLLIRLKIHQLLMINTLVCTHIVSFHSCVYETVLQFNR